MRINNKNDNCYIEKKSRIILKLSIWKRLKSIQSQQWIFCVKSGESIWQKNININKISGKDENSGAKIYKVFVLGLMPEYVKKTRYWTIV